MISESPLCSETAKTVFLRPGSEILKCAGVYILALACCSSLLAQGPSADGSFRQATEAVRVGRLDEAADGCACTARKTLKRPLQCFRS
jgi:hypothetical protein